MNHRITQPRTALPDFVEVWYAMRCGFQEAADWALSTSGQIQVGGRRPN